MNATLLAPSELKENLSGPKAPVLLDVRLEDDFARAHLPQAKNNCVFEINFLDRMSALVPDRDATICVYGEGADSLESRIASEKLTRAGYPHVAELRAGLQAWKAAGFQVEGDSSGNGTSHHTIADGAHNLDLAESLVEWTGRNLLSRHHGRLGIKDGSLRFEHGKLVGGEVLFDMNDITCYNLKGNELHDVLVRHLKSDDFFDVEMYPTARLAVLSSAPTEEATPGSPNLQVRGELSLKNVTHPLEFTVCAGITPEGKPAAQVAFAFDRTKWNVLYGSGRFFHRLEKHLVNDLIEVQARMVVL
jgi:rhodanese-related sulfurtransferase